MDIMQFYQTPFEAAYSDLAKQRNLRKLEALFLEADSDGSGAMSFDEFREALRKPWIQRTFSSLGVQPHQSELVFRSMVKGKNKDELRIDAFIEGLTRLVGTSIDGTGRELDITMLKPTRAAKLKRQQTLESAWLPAAGQSMGSAGVGLGFGPVHLLPEDTIQRAFVHSAAAKALRPPNASTKTVRHSPD
uniref:EF-hand domain-containing protein n=1 Tax=Alexandrium andersonii TaxID=327968 RepID=A0A7S2JDC1_9DINO